jgi:hypothetical protein
MIFSYNPGNLNITQFISLSLRRKMDDSEGLLEYEQFVHFPSIVIIRITCQADW